jgi:coenzyme F420-reducing hydrogenase delta subunit/Fe-S-cluster-containing hydrogenase component 2
MCSGRVDLEFVFRALAKGMDGVFIGACRLGECNYVTHGNYHAQNMTLLGKKILEYIGLNPERLMIGFMSSGEGNIFAETVDDFSRQAASLGPLGSSEGIDSEEVSRRLSEVVKLIPYIKIVKRDKLEATVEEGAEDGFYTVEEVERLFSEVDSYRIDPDKCQACMICARKCPVQAVIGAKGQVHLIDQDKCIRCGTCYEACPPRFGAVEKSRTSGLDPLRVAECGPQTEATTTS